jgi:hypothetical protein
MLWKCLAVSLLALSGCAVDDRGTHRGSPESDAESAGAGDAGATLADGRPPGEAGLARDTRPADAPVPGDAPAPMDASGPARLDAALDGAGCTLSGCPAPANGDASCVAGSCGYVCHRGYHKDGAGCAPNDQPGCCGDACTVCGVPVNGTAACTNRQCVLGCNAGYHLVGSQCQPDESSACCGPACALCPPVLNGSPICRNHTCDLDCNAGFHKDGATCARDDDPACCGLACKTCDAPANASPVCKNAACSFTCHDGFHAAGNGCQPNQDTSCCGNKCETCTATRPNATPVCDGKKCLDTSPCLPTHHDCNGVCLPNDAVTSCGSACLACPARANSTVSCDGSGCVYACAAGFADCDGNPNNGCEATPASDPLNCGACAVSSNDAHTCATGGSFPQTCTNGLCSCPAGRADCNGDRADGCEVNVQTSNVHCGACNPANPSELDLLTQPTYDAAHAAPACKVYALEFCTAGVCAGP